MSTSAIKVEQSERAYTLSRKALRRVIPVLRDLISDTTDLQTHVEDARSNVPESERRIRSLFEGLNTELADCSSLLNGRLRMLPSTLHLPERFRTDSNTFWRLYPGHELDCRENLELLLAGYSHYARKIYESVRTLECIGDTESVEIVSRLIGAAEKGLCFIELYLEGFALHMDGERMPAWPSADI